MLWAKALMTQLTEGASVLLNTEKFDWSTRAVAFFGRASLLVALIGILGPPAYGQPAVTLSPTSLTFSVQSIGTSSPSQTITLTNTGNGTLNLTEIVVAGSFSGDFQQSNNCPPSLGPGVPCSIYVVFAPTGTGGRTAALLIFDNASNSPQSVRLSGIGLGTITNISDSAYRELNSRTSANQNNFYVYLDADSGFNHGFPSGFFGTGPISTDTGCLDDPADLTVGCFPTTDKTDFDGTHGTVLRVTLGPYSSGEFSGLNIQDLGSNSYDLSPATAVTLDVRSPNSATVQFGIGGCITEPIGPIALTWSKLTISLATDLSCQPDIANLGILFSVQAGSPYGGTVLVDNVQFTPVPSRANQGGEILSFPLATQTFGVVPQQAPPIAPDQNNRNVTTIYESALTLLALLHRGNPADVTNALQIATTFDYALFHDSHGDPLPQAPGNLNGCYDGSRALQCGLHSVYESGDIGLLNGQGSGMAQAGDVRLAGFTAGTTLCGPSGFCLVQDGATGGNNAFAIFALAAAYGQPPSQNSLYLNDALAIGNWIVANLTSGEGYGGYYVGYTGVADYPLPPHQLILSKSTENNADIFAAFSLLAQIEAALGNGSAAAQWTNNANVAGNFVMAMFDPVNGRFNAGTVPQGTGPGPGVCPTGPQKGNDVINAFPCDFLDADSFTTLGLAGSNTFGISSRGSIDWQQPLEYMLNFSQSGNSFTQAVTADGLTFSGFDLVPAPQMTGVAWEFTGQTVGICTYVDMLYNETSFQSCATTYQNQILQAANSAPFGDGIGVVAGTRQNGDTLPPLTQCVQTPFQCIPERVGLAATNWAIFASQGFNPLSFPAVTLSPSSLSFVNQTVGTTSNPQTVALSNIGTAALSISGITTTGDFAQTNNCGSSISPGANCPISVTFTPTVSGTRTGTLTVSDNANGSPQTASLSGNVTDFQVTATALSPPSVSPGGSATSIITVVPMNGFAGTITLSCSSITPQVSLPPTCSFSSTTIPNASGTSTLTVSTTGSSGLLTAPSMHRSGPLYAMLLPIGTMALIGMGFTSVVSRMKRLLLNLLVVSLMISGLILLANCGGGHTNTVSGNQTPPGPYTITVTGSASGTTPQSTMLSLTVQ